MVDVGRWLSLDQGVCMRMVDGGQPGGEKAQRVSRQDEVQQAEAKQTRQQDEAEQVEQQRRQVPASHAHPFFWLYSKQQP